MQKLTLEEPENVLTIIGVTRDVTLRRIAEENKKNYQNKMEILSKTAMSFMKYKIDENIYNLIGQNLTLLINDAYIIINSIKNKTNTTEAVFGLNNHIEIINKIINKKIIGLKIPLSEEAYQKLKDGELIVLSNGIIDLMLNSVPHAISYSIEKTT